MQLQLLVSFNNETKIDSFQINCLEDLKQSISVLFPEYNDNAITYYDDEGDKVKITCKPEFDEAISFARANGDFFSIVVEEEAPAAVPSVPDAQPEPVNPVQNIFAHIQNLLAPIGSGDLAAVLNEDNIEQAFSSLKDEIAPVVQHIEKVIPEFVDACKNEIEAKLQNQPLEEELEQEIEIEQPEEEEEVEKVRHNAICDKCDKHICGIRYKCIQCADYDLCAECEGPNSGHDENHVFAKLYTKQQRFSSAFQSRERHQRGCGGRRRVRVEKLEANVALLQQQVEDLLAKQAEEVPEFIEEPIEDVEPEEECEEQEVRAEESVSDATKQMLETLNAMGFMDNAANLAALEAHNFDLAATLATFFD